QEDRPSDIDSEIERQIRALAGGQRGATTVGKRTGPGARGSNEAAGAETRERKRVLVLEGELTGLASLRRRVGDARAQRTVEDFFKIAENVAYKHAAAQHRVDSKADAVLGGHCGFTYLIGLPVTSEVDPPRAIRLALALVDALDGIGRDVE